MELVKNTEVSANQKPTKAYIILTENCINTCKFCYNSNKRDSRILSFQEWKNILMDLLTWTKLEKIYIIGGEPLTHPDCFKLIKWIATQNVKIHLFSGGHSNWNDSSMKEISNYIDGMTISFHALNEIIGKTTKSKQSELVSLASRYLATKSDKDIALNTLMTRQHAAKLEQIIKEVESLTKRKSKIDCIEEKNIGTRHYLSYPAQNETDSDIWHLFGWPFPSGKMINNQDELSWHHSELSTLFTEQEQKLLFRAWYSNLEIKNQIFNVNGYPCGVDINNGEGAAGINRITFRFDGHVVPCHINYSYSYGNATTESTEAIWENNYKLFRTPNKVNVVSLSNYLNLKSKWNCVAAMQAGLQNFDETTLVDNILSHDLQ